MAKNISLDIAFHPKNIYLCSNTIKQKTMEALNRYLPLLADYMQKHANTYHISRMGIFGSIARGEETETSDVDVCFEGEAPSLFTMARIKRELEELFGRTVENANWKNCSAELSI